MGDRRVQWCAAFVLGVVGILLGSRLRNGGLKEMVEVVHNKGEGELGRWFNKRALSDLTIESRDGHVFYVHKLVLAVASPFFEKEFAKNRKSHLKAPLNTDALQWILNASYTNDGVLTDENVLEVRFAAHMYELAWIEAACLEYIRDQGALELAAFECKGKTVKWHWQVPESKWYFIVAAGAATQDWLTDDASGIRVGGQGAIVAGAFKLNKGDVLHIVTGAIPITPLFRDPLHSGGGTFVTLNNKKIKKKILLAVDRQSGLGQLDRESWIGWDALAEPSSNYSTVGDEDNNIRMFVSGDALNAWKRIGSRGPARVAIWNGINEPIAKEYIDWFSKTFAEQAPTPFRYIKNRKE